MVEMNKNKYIKIIAFVTAILFFNLAFAEMGRDGCITLSQARETLVFAEELPQVKVFQDLGFDLSSLEGRVKYSETLQLNGRLYEAVFLSGGDCGTMNPEPCTLYAAITCEERVIVHWFDSIPPG